MRVLTLPALWHDVQLGMLYNARTGEVFSGVSLWDNVTVNQNQALDDHTVQNAEFSYSFSLEEARKNAALGLEGSLSLDLKIIDATGSATYLNDKMSSAFEVRADVSCTVVRRTRRIPQETLSSMQHKHNLEDPRFTHFVAEVIEGGSATLSFVQLCSSADEHKKASVAMQAKIMKLSVGSNTEMGFSEADNSASEALKISYSGAIAENVATLDDARRVAREMPGKLKKQLNTLRYKLLPLSILDNSVERVIRDLDADLVRETASALKIGVMTRLKLGDLAKEEVYQTSFPKIRQQIVNMGDAFHKAEAEFTEAARCLLLELRDGNTDHNSKRSELVRTVALFKHRTRIANQFTAKKSKEARILHETIALLLTEGFENHLSEVPAASFLENDAPRLLLSFGGSVINRLKHPLQEAAESAEIISVSRSNSDDSDVSDEDEDEWFDNQQAVANLREACAALRQQRERCRSTAEATIFGVAAIDKALNPGTSKRKKTRTRVGDILLVSKGKVLIVTSMLPKHPISPTLSIKGQSIMVYWSNERTHDEELAIPTTGFIVSYRPIPNPRKDGAFPRTIGNEKFMEIHREASERTATIDDATNGGRVSDDCDYEVALSVSTIIGRTSWSQVVVGRTDKQPSVASYLVDFYRNNHVTLSQSKLNATPWRLSEGDGKRSLFLGLSTKELKLCTDRRFRDQLAVRIVDVAAEFEPEVTPADIDDQENTIVVVFVGTSGHGKSTEINAFVSYLLGGEADDWARIMVIDDRGTHQAHSVTQYVTCYRVRPLSPLFNHKTLLIVDTPGYGDTKGVKSDAFVTAAMSELFKTIKHVNSIVFACKADDVRLSMLRPVSAYVFSLFAKNIRSCLLTVFTFAGPTTPMAGNTLRKLQWPVDNGNVAVNNHAFTVTPDTSRPDLMRPWWHLSVMGQDKLMKMLLSLRPVSTHASADVTQRRLQLEQRSALVERKILITANDAQNLITNLSSLANAVGAAPSDKIEIEEDAAKQVPLEQGKATTLCLTCNRTCHQICQISDDAAKARCWAMKNDYCRICRKGCHWSEHRNARFIIEIEKRRAWVVPKELIKRWNNNNNTLEGALLSAIDAYLGLQRELHKDILFLAQLTDELMNTALVHNPDDLIEYIDTLIVTARQTGAPAEQVVQLNTAKNTFVVMREVKHQGKGAARLPETLVAVLGTVREEMKRRMNLEPNERAREEEIECTLYDELRLQLPPEICGKAPEALKKTAVFFTNVANKARALTSTNPNPASGSPRYPENLRAVVKLVQVLLRDGSIVSALSGTGGSAFDS